MKHTLLAGAVIACLAGFASIGFSDDEAAKPAMDAGSHAMEGKDAAGSMPMEKASDEHIKMRRMIGEWECSMSMVMGPDQVMESKGTSKCVQFGEFWILEEAEYDMFGMPFRGHGIHGYNAATKKYVSTWVDTSASWGMNSEGDLEADGTLVLKSTGPDYLNPGKMTTYTLKMKWQDDDHYTLSMFAAGPDGNELEFWTLKASRKK